MKTTFAHEPSTVETSLAQKCCMVELCAFRKYRIVKISPAREKCGGEVRLAGKKNVKRKMRWRDQNCSDTHQADQTMIARTVRAMSPLSSEMCDSFLACLIIGLNVRSTVCRGKVRLTPYYAIENGATFLADGIRKRSELGFSSRCEALANHCVQPIMDRICFVGLRSGYPTFWISMEWHVRDVP